MVHEKRTRGILGIQVTVQCPMTSRSGITNQAIDPEDYCPLLRGRQVVSSSGRAPVTTVRPGIVCVLAETNQREVSFHGTQETVSVLFRANNGRLALVGAAQERGVFHPALQLLVPCVSPDVVCLTEMSVLHRLSEASDVPTMPTTSSFFALSTPTTRE